MAILVVLIL